MIIWIASYPKCGNTWVRSLISAYYFSKDGEFNFDLLKILDNFQVHIFFLIKLILLKKMLQQSWLPVQKKIKGNKKGLFFKNLHNVYGAYKGNNFTTPDYTLGAINIVRDPRNVITSLMNHFSINEEDALKMMSNVNRNLRDRNDKDNYATYSFISSWDKNYKSWKITKNINKILIKYEDLENDIENTFLKFLNSQIK